MEHRAAPFPIRVPYLLALNVGLKRHAGRYYADASWAKDLLAHLDAIERLTVFCPVVEAPPADDVPVDHPRLTIVSFEARGRARFLLAVPATLARLWREVGRAGLVHTGVAGWPWPIGWAASLFARARGRPLAIVVESSFWRLAAGERAGLRRWIGAGLWERLARACLASADYAAFTQPAYRQALPAPRAGGGVIAPAAWIDESDRLDGEAVACAWNRREQAPAAMLFASRLVPEKGTRVVLAALRRLAEHDADVRLDVIGAGPDAELFRAAAAGWAAGRMRLLDPVPYGSAFFALLDGYRAIVVPLLADEQPRIILDAAARGIATVGSDRAGVASLIDDGATGLLPPAGDAAALAEAIATAATPRWRAMGLAAHARSAALTHKAMHARRAADLAAMLDRLKKRRDAPSWHGRGEVPQKSDEA